MQEGWLCPRCGRIWAPWVASCNCSTDPGITKSIPLPYIIPNTGDPIPDGNYTICERSQFNG